MGEGGVRAGGGDLTNFKIFWSNSPGGKRKVNQKCKKRPHPRGKNLNKQHYNTILGIPIDRVPTSKSCVFCLGIKFLIFPIWPFLGPFLLQGLFSWKVLRFSLVALQTSLRTADAFPVNASAVRRLFTNLLCKSVKCLERIKSALQRKRSGLLLSPATNLLSVRFHIVDKHLHSLII